MIASMHFEVAAVLIRSVVLYKPSVSLLNDPILKEQRNTEFMSHLV
jgi:hypothetical protein